MTEEQKPWYKHPHVWLLITFPALAIIGGIDMLYLAATSTDSLVSDNYYKEGNNINQRLALEKAATTKGITGQVYLGEDQKSVRVLFNKNDLGPIKLKLVHATLSGLDQEVTLNNTLGSMYTGTLTQGLQQGNWYVELSDAKKSWSIRKSWSTQHHDSLTFP
ncbi:FixH family protein [Deefgea rivuli]|uniref:FixH family protein n=1 Tax=Deefgea rivuli TaxID=400948 RepID=UPI000685A4FB|nr:FixH family protein [Deefgea rivuli]